MWTNITIEEYREIREKYGKEAALREVRLRSTPMECMSKVADRYHEEAMNKIRKIVQEEIAA